MKLKKGASIIIMLVIGSVPLALLGEAVFDFSQYLSNEFVLNLIKVSSVMFFSAFFYLIIAEMIDIRLFKGASIREKIQSFFSCNFS